MKLLAKNIKRLVAIITVVVLNTNVFATTNNHLTSGFVTKTEYDAIKKEFDLEMDRYQNGLNAKIDTAISKYLGSMSSLSTGKGTNLIEH